ncbi:MAG: hypothetical protein ACRCZF_02050, partial [Gemmataceae bacterium]
QSQLENLELLGCPSQRHLLPIDDSIPFQKLQKLVVTGPLEFTKTLRTLLEMLDPSSLRDLTFAHIRSLKRLRTCSQVRNWQLARLELSSCLLDDDALERVLQNMNLSEMIELKVDRNFLTRSFCETLVTRRSVPQLRSFSCIGNGWSEADQIALRRLGQENGVWVRC